MKDKKPQIVIIETITTVLFILILLFVFLQVLFRYVLKISVPWTEEGSRFLLIWMVFLGSVATMAADRDIRLNILSSKLSLRARRTLDIFIHLVIMVFGIIFLKAALLGVRISIPILSASARYLAINSLAT